MNSVAARAMACMLLPSSRRPPYCPSTSPALSSTGSSTGAQYLPGGKRAPSPSPSQRNPGTSSFAHGVGSATAASLTAKPGGGSSTGGNTGVGSTTCGSTVPPPQGPTQLLSDLVVHLCSHPLYRLLSLRALPHVPPSSVDFSTFTWPAINKRLRQMAITGG
jgi:hypothetical protein